MAPISVGSKFQDLGFLEDEDVVVGQAVHRGAESIGLAALAAEEVALGAPPPAPLDEAAVHQLRIVEAHHPPAPGRGDGVGDGEARDADVGPGARARAAQQGVAQHVAGVLDDEEAVTVGDVANHVPVRAVADQVGGEDRLRARAHHLLDAAHVDLVAGLVHVDEGRHHARPHHGGDVGREGEHRGDDLVAGLQVEEVEGEVDGGGTGVHHHAVALGHQLGHPRLELAHLVADHESAVLQEVDDGVDLLLSMVTAGRSDLSHAATVLRSRPEW